MNNTSCASNNERSHTAGARLSQDNMTKTAYENEQPAEGGAAPSVEGVAATGAAATSACKAEADAAAASARPTGEAAGGPASSAGEASPDADKLTYRDALAGRVPVPTDKLGFFVFQTLMVGGMVSFMATLNGVRHDGMGFVLYMHWFYPVVFVVAFIIRRTIGNAVTGFVIPRFIVGRFEGTVAAFAKCLANVGIMCPLVSLVVSILLDGADFLPFYLSTLPISLPCAIAANYLVVGPAVKLLYANHIARHSSTKIIALWQRYARTLTALLGLS